MKKSKAKDRQYYRYNLQVETPPGTIGLYEIVVGMFLTEAEARYFAQGLTCITPLSIREVFTVERVYAPTDFQYQEGQFALASTRWLVAYTPDTLQYEEGPSTP